MKGTFFFTNCNCPFNCPNCPNCLLTVPGYKWKSTFILTVCKGYGTLFLVRNTQHYPLLEERIMYKLFKKHYDKIRECVINAIVEQCFCGRPQSVVLWSDGDVDFYDSCAENYLGYFNTVEGVVLFTSYGKREYVEAFEEEEEFRERCRDFVEGETLKDIMYEIEMRLFTEDICVDKWQ